MALGWDSLLEWTVDGFLPGNDPADSVSSKRSPYSLSLPEFVHRFGQSVERRSLMNGLLRYRALLQQAGLGAGFQWINGSFVEDVERIRGRPPADIDVVTFIFLPTGVSELDFYGSHGGYFRQGLHQESFFHRRIHRCYGSYQAGDGSIRHPEFRLLVQRVVAYEGAPVEGLY